MIQGLVAKKIIDSIVKKVMDNRELKKIYQNKFYLLTHWRGI